MLAQVVVAPLIDVCLRVIVVAALAVYPRIVVGTSNISVSSRTLLWDLARPLRFMGSPSSRWIQGEQTSNQTPAAF